MTELVNPKELGAEARNLYQKGEYVAAAQTFQACAYAYTSLSQAALAVEMRSNASVAFLMAGELPAALDALAGVEEFYAQSGDIRSLALAVGNRAAILDQLRQDEAALAAYERCADLLKQAGDFESRSYVMQSLSKLQLRRGQQLQALATMQAGIDAIPNPSPRQKLLKRLLKIPAGFLNLKS